MIFCKISILTIFAGYWSAVDIGSKLAYSGKCLKFQAILANVGCCRNRRFFCGVWVLELVDLNYLKLDWARKGRLISETRGKNSIILEKRNFQNLSSVAGNCFKKGKWRKNEEVSSESCVISWNRILLEILAFRVLSSELTQALLSVRGSVFVVSSQGKSNFTRNFKFWKYAGKCFKNFKKILKIHDCPIRSVRKKSRPTLSNYFNFFWR